MNIPDLSINERSDELLVARTHAAALHDLTDKFIKEHQEIDEHNDSDDAPGVDFTPPEARVTLATPRILLQQFTQDGTQNEVAKDGEVVLESLVADRLTTNLSNQQLHPVEQPSIQDDGLDQECNDLAEQLPREVSSMDAPTERSYIHSPNGEGEADLDAQTEELAKQLEERSRMLGGDE